MCPPSPTPQWAEYSHHHFFPPEHSPTPALGTSALEAPEKSFSCVLVPTGYAGQPVSTENPFPESPEVWAQGFSWYLLVRGLCRVSLT